MFKIFKILPFKITPYKYSDNQNIENIQIFKYSRYCPLKSHHISIQTIKILKIFKYSRYCPLKSHHTNIQIFKILPFKITPYKWLHKWHFESLSLWGFTFFKGKQHLANASVFVFVFVSAFVFALYGTIGFDTKAKDITPMHNWRRRQHWPP